MVGSNVWGDLACLGAAGCYGLASPVMARLRHLPPLSVAAGQLLSSTLILLPAAALMERPWTLPSPSLGAWGALVGLALLSTALALLSTALAYAVYFRLVARAGPANAMSVTYMVLVTALALGHLALHEPITLNAVLGAGVILAGLALVDGRWLPRREAV